MAQVVIRNLEDELKARLKDEAARHGWSMEEEARQILRNALKGERRPIRLGTKMASRFMGQGLDSDLPELHGEPIQPMDVSE